MLTTLIFDFDGTLADTLPLILKSIGKISSDFDINELTEKDFERYRKLGARKALKEFKISPLKILPMIKKVRESLTQELSTARPFEGMPDAVRKLHEEGFILGIVTSNSVENAKAFVVQHNMDFFKFIYSEQKLFGKATVIRKLLKEYRLSKDEVMYIGDEVRDIEAGKKAGIMTAAVTWGFNEKQVLAKENPDYLIDSAGQLIEIPHNHFLKMKK